METRRFGRSGHQSSVAIFGGAGLGGVTQDVADRAMEQIIAAGVNHIDVAASYGEAELRVGPWMERERNRFFLGSKTEERQQQGAWDSVQRSLERLRTDHLDLIQIHAITRMDELDAVLAPGGVLDALLQAREQGLTKYIGITGHGNDAPAIFLEALRRFDFDSILFPINFVQYAMPDYRRNAEALVAECRKRDVGTLIIKAVGKGVWRDAPRTADTWYVPFTDPAQIQAGVNFSLSQDVTGLCTAGDVNVLPLFLEACENFTPLTRAEQDALIATADRYESVFALNGP